MHQGHHLGGKAASYRDADNRVIEHGWHMVVGFYDAMRALMRRAGVDPADALSPLSGVSHIYEKHSDRLHKMQALSFENNLEQLFSDAISDDDRVNWNTFFARMLLRLRTGERLEIHDDICTDTWAVEHGLRPHLVRTSQFRFFREAYFNYPEAVSAYHVLQSARLMTRRTGDQAMSVCRGGYSERIWQPIGRYFESMGGTIEPYSLATDWVWRGRTLTGVRVGRPDSRGHNEGQSSWQRDRISVAAGTERLVDDFDVVVSTIPHAVFVMMNADNEEMWSSPFFARLKNLRSGATVSMTVWTNERLPYVEAPVYGFPAPLGICVDMTPHRDGADAPRGSELWFVGQESGFEAWSDDEIASYTLDQFARVPAYAGLKQAVREKRASVELHRNRSAFERLLLCEPGVNVFRPTPQTPFHNLFLAGDWVRNAVDLICMEGAITSGIDAANLALAHLAAKENR